MHIELTDDEYRKLLDVLYMGEWMMHAHEIEKDPATEPYDRIIQKFFALAPAAGCGDLIEYDADTREYYVTRRFEEESVSGEFIDAFTDETFWDELLHRLTDRDVARKVGGYDSLDRLNMKDRFTFESPILEKYSREFEERGLDRLEIFDQPGAGVARAQQTHD